jgi:hypothetical protein
MVTRLAQGLLDETSPASGASQGHQIQVRLTDPLAADVAEVPPH